MSQAILYLEDTKTGERFPLLMETADGRWQIETCYGAGWEEYFAGELHGWVQSREALPASLRLVYEKEAVANVARPPRKAEN